MTKSRGVSLFYRAPNFLTSNDFLRDTLNYFTRLTDTMAAMPNSVGLNRMLDDYGPSFPYVTRNRRNIEAFMEGMGTPNFIIAEDGRRISEQTVDIMDQILVKYGMQINSYGIATSVGIHFRNVEKIRR